MKPASVSKSTEAPTRVVLVDDHASIRQMLGVILKIEGGYQIVGEAAGGMDALKVCRATRPKLVILDLALPELCGTHLIRLLLQEPWPMRVVVYSGAMDDDLLREALAEGPHGFVKKEDSLLELREALRAVTSGSRHISPCSARLLSTGAEEAFKCLTTQERAVLQMVAEGRKTKKIARALGAAAKTVEHHRQHVMRKLGLHDAASLTRYAVRHRMVSA